MEAGKSPSLIRYSGVEHTPSLVRSSGGSTLAIELKTGLSQRALLQRAKVQEGTGTLLVAEGSSLHGYKHLTRLQM